MKMIRHTDSQILSILKQNEMGKSVPDLCREHGMALKDAIEKSCKANLYVVKTFWTISCLI